MRKILLIFVLVLLGASMRAQVSNPGVKYVAVAPSGSCPAHALPVQVSYSNEICTCGAGTWSCNSGGGTGGPFLPLTGGTLTGPLTMTAGAGTNVNVKSYGAKGDERFVTDAAMTGSSATVTSATAAFTSADTGKTMTVNAGTAGVLSATYTSGGTVSGNSNGLSFCDVTFTNGGGSAAAGWVEITGSGGSSIAPGGTILINNPGTGFTSNPTAGTLSNGYNGGTCSGTIVLASSATYYAPVTGTFTYTSATTGTLSANAVNTVSGAKAAIGTDDSTAITNAINAVSTAGGGTVYFPASSYLVLSQIVIPNTANYQPAITFLGDGSRWDSSLSQVSVGPPSVTALDLRYSGATGKINTTGHGSLSFSKLSLENNGYDTAAFVYTTNTALFPSEISVVGGGPGQVSSSNDGFELGEENLTHPFQGYGTVISKVFFSRIHRGIWGQTYTNAVVIRDNTWSNDCGGDTAMLFDGSVGEAENNVYTGNLFEIGSYLSAVTFTNSSANYGMGNTFWDGSAIYVELNGTSPYNICVMCGGTGNLSASFVDNGTNGFIFLNGGDISVPGGSNVAFDTTNTYAWRMRQIGVGLTATWDLVHGGVADALQFDAAANAMFQSNAGVLTGKHLNFDTEATQEWYYQQSGTSTPATLSLVHQGNAVAVTYAANGDAAFQENLAAGAGTNILYYCSAGVSAGNLCRGNGCSCAAGTWTDTGLRVK
jgi:hypothetical protein